MNLWHIFLCPACLYYVPDATVILFTKQGLSRTKSVTVRTSPGQATKNGSGSQGGLVLEAEERQIVKATSHWIHYLRSFAAFIGCWEGWKTIVLCCMLVKQCPATVSHFSIDKHAAYSPNWPAINKNNQRLRGCPQCDATLTVPHARLPAFGQHRYSTQAQGDY